MSVSVLIIKKKLDLAVKPILAVKPPKYAAITHYDSSPCYTQLSFYAQLCSQAPYFLYSAICS